VIFNELTKTTLAFFAIFGIIALFDRKLPINIFRRSKFLTAFCTASFFAFIAEFMFVSAEFEQIFEIAEKKQFLLNFSGLRLLVVSFLLFAIFCFVNKTLRAKTSYYLFEYKFDPTNRKQNIVYVFCVVLLILFSWICVYTSLSKEQREYPPYQQYNKYLVDAIISGRTYLDYGNPEKLLNAERPYDINYLIKNDYKRDVDWMFDWAWYKGKHYCYFGVVPAIILYIPYKIITGNYLSNQAGVFLFSAIAVVLLAMLWQFCVKKYMPNARFAFYLLSFMTLFFASGLFAVLRYPLFYTIVQSAGFMFSIAGIFLLFKSVENEKVNHIKLFFACLCLALVVGCRPNLIFVSLFVPVILWKYRSWKLLLFIMIPYIMVAIPLCMYNYARFDSIFEFGPKYNLSMSNLTAYGQLNPIGKIIQIFVFSVSYMFTPNIYSLYFPFVQCLPYDHSIVTMGIFRHNETGGSGIINFPIVLCLFYLFKKKFEENKRIIYTFLIVALSIILVNSFIAGFIRRYVFDFSTFIIIPSLFCAYYWWKAKEGTNRLKLIYVLLAFSIFVGLFLFVTGLYNNIVYKDTTLYRYLEYSLGILRLV
jgi:hypothetical protein